MAFVVIIYVWKRSEKIFRVFALRRGQYRFSLHLQSCLTDNDSHLLLSRVDIITVYSYILFYTLNALL